MKEFVKGEERLMQDRFDAPESSNTYGMHDVLVVYTVLKEGVELDYDVDSKFPKILYMLELARMCTSPSTRVATATKPLLGAVSASYPLASKNLRGTAIFSLCALRFYHERARRFMRVIQKRPSKEQPIR